MAKVLIAALLCYIAAMEALVVGHYTQQPMDFYTE
jgi:hypothetical protein